MATKLAAPADQTPRRGAHPAFVERLGDTRAVRPDPPRTRAALALDDPELDDHTVWEQALVTGDLTGVVAHDVEILECVIEQAQLTSARLEGATIVDTLFDGCQMSGAALRDATLKRVELRNCRLSSLDLSGSRLQDVTFTDCRLDWANLRSTTGERVRVVGSDLSDASLYAAELVGLDLFDCTLTRAEFSKSKLTQVRLHGSTLDDIRGPLSLGGAIIASTQLVPLALPLFAELGISIDDDARDDPDEAGS
jgi:hypothetical protein